MGDGVNTITRVILMECVKIESEWRQEVNNNRDCMKKGVSKEYIKSKYNYSNKPKLKLSMFDVKIIIYWQPWR